MEQSKCTHANVPGGTKVMTIIKTARLQSKHGSLYIMNIINLTMPLKKFIQVMKSIN